MTTILLNTRHQTVRRIAPLASHLSKSFSQPQILTRTMASSSLPKTMKGIFIQKTGGVEVLDYRTDLPLPVPKEGEALVKNEFIGVNYIDTYFRTGLYPAEMPYMLGREAEGTIVDLKVGKEEVPKGLEVGKRVVYLGMSAYAEFTSVPLEKVYPLPKDLPEKIAAASLLQGLTALTLIREAHHVQAGDWVLVHAAAGGVGLWLCQLLRAVGAHVIGTASTPEKLQLAKDNGAEIVINYKSEGSGSNIVQLVLSATNGEGVSVVYDSTGKDQFENDLQLVKRKGSVVSYGNSSGAVPPLTIAKLTAKNLRLMRPTLFGYIATREEFERYTEELFDFIIKDRLNVRVHEVYPLEEVKRAHEDIEGRKTTGKLLLKP